MVNRDEAVEYALKEARDNDVKFIRLWFADILGSLKGFAITVEELESTLTRGMGFDGSAIEGFARNEEIDLYALPDPNTFSILPWRPKENAVARMFCDIITPDEKPFEGDSRYVLRQNIKRAADMGYTYYVGPELEYFYFKSANAPELLDTGGYFDQDASDISTDLRREAVLMLEELGIPVEQSHHEVAPSQHEIDLRHTDAMTMADTVMTYRVAVKEVAQRHGCFASFMPKPIADQNGSGMHTHQSLFKGGRNSFYDSEDPDRLSDNARYFIAGLLKHAREITAVTNQWVNSYKRLVPNFEAPTFVSWATVNRADLIRVPAFKPGREESRRIEYRAPDPACNPYLSFSVMLAAGLDGIKKKIELPPPTESNVHQMSVAERAERNIESLPGSLWEAISITEKSELVRNALGDSVFDSFIENKKIEWERYRSHVSDYEIARYLPAL
jgi:glutamine synthetase